MSSLKTLVVIAGPTAIGKTDLAIKIALHFRTEIISADSRQFYKEMAIGTAKPSLEELATVKHHFIDSLSVKEDFSVGDFEEQALNLIDELFSRNDTLVLVGGSGLFIKAITEGFDVLPKTEPAVRDKLNQEFKEKGIIPLQEQLKKLDPAYYEEVDLNNPQRLIRALEVFIGSGKPFSSFRSKMSRQRNFHIVKIGLDLDREKLYERINKRVDLMITGGLVKEVESLLPYRHLNALKTVGYTEIFDFLDGKITLNEAIESIKRNTRRFAKRQLTWFRKDAEIGWFRPDQYEEILKYIESKTVV